MFMQCINVQVKQTIISRLDGENAGIKMETRRAILPCLTVPYGIWKMVELGLIPQWLRVYALADSQSNPP